MPLARVRTHSLPPRCAWRPSHSPRLVADSYTDELHGNSATTPLPRPPTARVGPAYANHELTRTRAPRARTHTRALPSRCAWRPLARASPRVVADSCADEHSRISPWPRSLARTAPYRAATRVPAPPTSHSVPPLPPQPLCSAGRAHLSAACTCAHLLRHQGTSLCGTVTSCAPLRLVGLTSPLAWRHLLPSPALGGVRRGGGVRKGVRLATVEHRPGVHFLRRVRRVCHPSLPSFGRGRTPFCGLGTDSGGS